VHGVSVLRLRLKICISAARWHSVHYSVTEQRGSERGRPHRPMLSLVQSLVHQKAISDKARSPTTTRGLPESPSLEMNRRKRARGRLTDLLADGHLRILSCPHKLRFLVERNDTYNSPSPAQLGTSDVVLSSVKTLRRWREDVF
jgi:hypothetical protein